MSKLHQLIQKSIILTLVLFGLHLLLPLSVQAQTDAWGSYCVGNTDNAQDVATITGIGCLLANVLSVAFTLIGLAGFVMLIIGSFRYMLSGSSSQGAEKARSTLTYAVTGLVVALSAFIILNLVSRFTGIRTILDFNIPNSDTQW